MHPDVTVENAFAALFGFAIHEVPPYLEYVCTWLDVHPLLYALGVSTIAPTLMAVASATGAITTR